MKKRLIAICLVIGSSGAYCQVWNDTGNPAVVPGTHFLGSTNNAQLDFRTNNTRYMHILANPGGQVINGYAGNILNGYVGIGLFNPLGPGNFVSRPHSLLHLNGGGIQDSGYRPWMQTGITMTRQTDQSYFGMKDEGGASNHTVVSWSDNNQGDPGPDLLKFIFVANNVAATGIAGTLDGLEAARFAPDNTGNQTFFGVGDWFTAGVQPTERLDVLDGRVRVRDLPTDPASVSNDFVTVDANGVLEHRVITNLPDNCEWTMNTGANNHVYTAFGAADPNCPDDADAVSVGLNLGVAAPPAKFNVRTTNFGIGSYVNASTTGAGFIIGGQFIATGGNGGSYSSGTRGIQAFSSGAGPLAVGRAGDFISNDNSQYTNGVHAQVNGGTYEASAVYGLCTSAASVNVGVTGKANTSASGSLFYGVRGIVTGTPTISTAYGVFGNVNASGATNSYGVYGRAQSGTNEYSVYGVLPTLGTINWSGFFEGPISAAGMVFPSDQNLKTEIEDLDNALDLLMDLHPKSYRYRQDEYPQMGLPQGQRYGFIAQDVQEVFPQFVMNSHQPAHVDSLGNEISAAVDYLALNTGDITSILVGAVQRQQVQLDAYANDLADEQATNAALNDQLQQVMDRLDAMEQNVADCCAAHGALENGDVETDEKSLNSNDRYLRIAPNPFETQTTVFYQLEKNGRMQLLANSADGKQLQVLQEAVMEAGNYEYEWATGDLAPGVYYVTLLMDGKPVTKRAVKILR